jgi:sec-independent protein translocase protein TatB
MLGLDWTELALILVVAVVVIGPKDLPDAVRGIAKGIQKLRRMAGDLQGQLDEVVREAKLEDVRNQINEIRSFDFRSVVEREVDKDGSIRKTFTEDPIGNPLKDAWEPKPADPPPGTPAAEPVHGAEPAPAAEQRPAAQAPAAPPVAPPSAPAFVPPGIAAGPPAPAATPSPAPSAPPGGGTGAAA